jgi:hypothetical protein
LTDKPTTVVPFKLIKNPAPPTEDAATSADCGITDEQLATMSEERKAVIGALANIGSFLLDNKLKIDSVICGVAVLRDDPDDPGGRDYFLLTTPISNADFALGLKLMESQLMANLQGGHY